MSRHKKHEEEENQERWLLTYSDMITLLVAFFMMMYSMSVINLEKFKKAAIGIRSGFNGQVLGEKESGDSFVEKGVHETKAMNVDFIVAPGPPELNLDKKKEENKTSPTGNRPTAAQLRARRIGTLVEQINLGLGEYSSHQAVKVIGEKKGVAIELMGDLIFFPKGSAELSDEAKKILRTVASVLSKLPNEISVEGYTSWFTAGQNPGYANSWELSTARGTSVVSFLLSTGTINPKHISVTGYGQYRPLAKTSDAIDEKNASNDRVRVFIYQE